MAWRSCVFAHTLVLGWGIALAAPAAWANEGACFGGAAEVVARNQPMAPCCREDANGAIVVGVTDLEADGVLALAGDGCRGDDSRLCCPLPAHGQLVRVERTLVRSGPRHYQLKSPQICQEPVAP